MKPIKGLASYSRQLMCEDTGISYEEPSPNAFSFNSPYGACPACKGLGTNFKVNLNAVIPDKSYSIKEGGIEPLGQEREAQVYKQMQAVAKKNKISLSTPITKLSAASLNIASYGNEEGIETEIDFENMAYDHDGEYEGIINMLKRWFNNGYSESLRNWAEEYMELKPCEVCNGARLKKESLFFKVAEKNIAELCNWNIDTLSKWFDDVEKDLSNKQK